MDAWSPGGGVLAGTTTSVPAWHCQPPGTNLSLETIPSLHHPTPHLICLLNLGADPKTSLPLGPPSCQPSLPPPHWPSLAAPVRSAQGTSACLAHHEDVRGDGPVRKQQRLPNKDTDLPRRREQPSGASLHQQPQLPLHPGCWQGAPKASHPSQGPLLLSIRLMRS